MHIAANAAPFSARDQQHFGVGWVEIFKNLLSFRKPVVGAKTEKLAIEKLDAIGIPTTPLVAFGERGFNPATKQSFLVTRDLGNIVSLEDYCADWLEKPPTHKFKLELIIAVATLAKKLHEAGLVHRDFYICHLCLDADLLAKGKIKLYLIDLHRVTMGRAPKGRAVMKDIAALYFSAMDIGLSSEDFDLFKQYYKKMLNECNKFFKKRSGSNHENPLNIINQIKPTTIEQNIKSAMMTGNWGKKKGVAQMYPRLTFLQSLSFLRRVDQSSSDSSTSKLTGPRHYHPSQVGFLCPVESPEHSNIGLVKHLTMVGAITTGSTDQAVLIYNMLNDNKDFIHLDSHSAVYLSITTRVFLNGEWIGMTDKPDSLYKELRLLKQNGIILRTNGIVHDISRGEIRIYTESGRLYRPVFNVRDNKVVITDKIIDDICKDSNLKGLNKFDALIAKYPETIDFLDMEEQFYALVAEYKDKVVEMKSRESGVYEDKNEPIINRYDNSMILKYTHCEFHPSLLLGIIAANIPYANHNQGPRNIFQYAKQSQGKLLI